MLIRLTEASISKSIKEGGPRRDLSDAGYQGLRLRLTSGGAASWVLACRDREGRMRRFPLGPWPTLGISGARNAARALHVQVKQHGADPIAQRRRERAVGEAARAGIGTLTAVLDLYGAKRGDAQKAWAEARKRINLLFKPLLSRPAHGLTRQDFQILADSYQSQSSASYAVRSLRPALKWAAQRGYIGEDAMRIVPPAPVKRRKRVLSGKELAALLPVLRSGVRAEAAARQFAVLTGNVDVSGLHWRQIDLSARKLIYRTKVDGKVTVHHLALPAKAVDLLRDLPGGEPGTSVFPQAMPYYAALLMMMLTMARREEVAQARWRDMDFDAQTWTIPDTKNGEPHTVPLPHQAIELLRSRLPAQNDGGILAPNPAGLVFATSTGGALGGWDRATKVIQEASGTEAWTRHDLRRTGATMLGDMGEMPDIIEATLNHTAIHSALAANYNRSRYRPQVAMALRRLADALDVIGANAAAV
jgi:integrase